MLKGEPNVWDLSTLVALNRQREVELAGQRLQQQVPAEELALRDQERLEELTADSVEVNCDP
jgi:hypothetical protein